ncbi:MAG TPA: pilus assembly protein N-terminal domain-containing protein [Vicinamibacterales bacterium]|nr:pilus assembly protein N-terminal domain-containing protein [Vicinamibacterales bacterium]
MRNLRTLAIFIVMVLPPVFSSTRLAANDAPPVIATEQIHLLVGRSAIVRTDRAIMRVSLSTADIADAMVTSPRELLVHGKAPGTISLLVWSETGRITTYEVTVRRDLTPLEGQIRKQFPNEPIAVAVNGKDVVLSGVVSAKYVIDRASSLAVGYVDKPENIVNLLRQQENVATNQVMLKVRFAEVSRSAMQELGASFFTGPVGKGDWIARGTTQQYAAPIFDKDKGLVFSDFLNLFAFNTEEQLGAAVRALKGRGLFESLAEPNLITQDGKEASFLAGGEYPYPVVQANGGNQSVTIVFKEFGVRLKFTPTITGGGFVHLKVAPEVSTLDFGNAVVLEGFRVPALATRRTSTEVELRDGQTFAISGLIDRNMNETLRRVPGIGDIPIIGHLFRSQAYQKNNTELVVMITPHIVLRDSPGVTPNLPGLVEPFLPGPKRTMPMPDPAFSHVAPAQPVGPTRTVVSTEPVSAPAATTVAAPSTAPAAREVAKASNAAVKIDRAAAERTKKEQEKAAKLETARAERQRELDEVATRKAREAAAIDAARVAKLQEQERKELERERKLEEKRLEVQAAADRKRWLEQQEQAARAKVVADKLAKEQARRDAELQKIENQRIEEERLLAEKHQKAQEKLAREQATRDADLEKLLTQYKRLTGGQQ